MSFEQEMSFTNKIHSEIAMPKFYVPNDMPNVVSEVGTLADLRDGVDYTVHHASGKITVQERFRRSKYKSYRDITFRYDKPCDPRDTRREFFKIKADAFLYGMVNDDGDDFEWAYMFSVEPVVAAVKEGILPTEYRRNRGPSDTGFIAIQVSDIDKLGATLIKYNL